MRILSWSLAWSLLASSWVLIGGCSSAPGPSQPFVVRELLLPRSDGEFVAANRLGRILSQVETMLAPEQIDLQHFFDVAPTPIELEVGPTGIVLVTEHGYVPFDGSRSQGHLVADASQPVLLSLPSLDGVTVTLRDAHLALDLDDAQPWLTGTLTGRLDTASLRTTLSPVLARLIEDHLASEPDSTLSTQLRALFDTGCSTDPEPQPDGHVSACEVAEEPLLWSLLGTTAPSDPAHSDAISAGVGLFAVQHR